MQSAGSLDKRDMQKLAGNSESGLSAWGMAFHDEGTIPPANNLQDASFDQKLSGLQSGVEWTHEFGGGSFSVGPMFSYGNASANQNASLSSARGDATAYGLNANYRFKNGFYVERDAGRRWRCTVDFKTPGTSSNAIGQSEAEGDGFNVELGYAHRLKSGLTLAPQLQYASVDVELDDFTSSDGVNSITDVGGKSSLLRAGLSVFKTFETTNGSITPHGRHQLPGRDGRRQHAAVQRCGVCQRHIGLGLPPRVRHRRPIQGLGYRGTGRPGGHHGVRAVALHERDGSVPLVSKNKT